STSISASSRAAASFARSTASAVGERQMLPLQTISTRIRGSAGRLDKRFQTFIPPPSPPPLRGAPLHHIRIVQAGAESLFAQLRKLVAHARRLLELEVARVFEHLLLERLDALAEILLGHRLDLGRGLRGAHFFLGRLVGNHAVDHVADALGYAAR